MATKPMKIRLAKKIIKGDWSRYTAEQMRRAVNRLHTPCTGFSISAIAIRAALEAERINRDVKEKFSSFMLKYYKERIDEATFGKVGETESNLTRRYTFVRSGDSEHLLDAAGYAMAAAKLSGPFGGEA